MSPHRWILRCRIGLARQILSTTNMPITDVATTCGFINTSHFIAKFKRQMGMTPNQYRARSKQ
jgi:AraC-like DNA-binding protein